MVHIYDIRPEKERIFISIYPYGYGKMLILVLEYDVEYYVLDYEY
ncbi:conserved hypothetical protein [Candidatus Nitrotoga sp. M5]|nr:conserved hypothetical protein [Candidatus Nitrotoga sp. M5]